MSRRLHDLDDAALADAIREAGGAVDWPSTPDVTDAVTASIHAVERRPSLVAPRLAMPSRRRTLLVIAAALLALAGAAIAARAVIELGAVAVQVLPGRPTGLPTDTTTEADLGREVTIDRAGAIAGFDAAMPAALGSPDRVWVDRAAIGPEPGSIARRIVSAWAPTAQLPPIPGSETGAVLMQFEGEWQVASKLVSAETNRFGETIVEGRPAFWTTGEHELVLVSGDEAVRLRVTGSVLIWQDAGFTFRLESDLGKADARRVAESVSPSIDLG